MKLYRITQAQFAHDLSGYGAEKYGGRWNSPGIPVLYTSRTPSMALLEVLAWTKLHLLLKGTFILLTLDADAENMGRVTLDALPEGWDKAGSTSDTRRIGDAWLRSMESLLMEVPSAIMPLESNVLINPAHTRMSRVHILEEHDLMFDMRVLQHLSENQ